jgi:hypothetical protein
MLEKERAVFAKDPAGVPIYPVFKLAHVKIPKNKDLSVAEDTSWSVWKAVGGAATAGSSSAAPEPPSLLDALKKK